MKSPAMLLRSLIRDLIRFHPECKGLTRDLKTCEKRIKYEGFCFLTKTLPSLSDALLRGLETGRFACPRNFKTVPRGRIPRLFSGIFCKVFDTTSGILIEGDNTEYILSIYQILSFFKKTASSSEQDGDLVSESARQFIDAEINWASHDVQSDLGFVIDRVSSWILPSLDSDVCISEPKHGPGAVVEGLLPNEKWKVISTVLRDRSVLADTCFGELGLLNDFDSSQVVAESSGQLSLDLRLPEALSDTSKLCIVPKDTKSMRAITIEPVAKQFAQQLYNSALRKAIPQCRILNRCLTLTDQTPNQKLALIGSHTKSYCTIDLKSASDLLSLDIVKRVFQRHAAFLNSLLLSRSSQVRSGETLIELKKYAGMGNATTFPVQSVVFAVIAISSELMRLNLGLTYRNAMRVAKNIRVFGDDIVVPNDGYTQVVRGLTSVGLVVNERKSFHRGYFRESCGCDAYRGVDITPVRLRTFPENLPGDPTLVSSLISTSNQLWLRCYYETATTIQLFVEKHFGKCLPLLSVDSAGIGLHTRQNAYQFKKYDTRLHRFLVYAPVVKPVKVSDPIDGYGALYKSLLTPLEGRDKLHLQKVPKRHLTKMFWEWVPPYRGVSSDNIG